MRRKLRDTRGEMTTKNDIRNLYWYVEYILWFLRNMNTSAAGGGGDEYHYEATTKAGLPDASTVPPGSIGRVNGVGADNGMVCVVNSTLDGWEAINVFE